MKCGHCAAKLERHEWFCPNCKRGQRGAAGPARPVGLLVTTVVACVALGASLGSRWRPTEPVVAAPAPVPAASSWPSALPASDGALHLATLSAPDGAVPGESTPLRAPVAPNASVRIRTLSPNP